MINGIGSSLSGVTAHKKKIEVTANNIANINTDGFKKSRAVFKEEPSGGVVVDVQRVDTPGTPIHSQEDEKQISSETSNVDYAEETVNMITARRGFEANLKALQVEDEILNSILDITV
ncbi:MAG: flagellar basal body rod C-terminal domain-containing protein [Pseudomonadota bacterium]